MTASTADKKYGGQKVRQAPESVRVPRTMDCLFHLQRRNSQISTRIPLESFQNPFRIPLEESLQNPSRILLESLQKPSRILLEALQKPSRIPLGSLQNPFRILLESFQNPFRIHLESFWKSSRIPCKYFQNPFSPESCQNHSRIRADILQHPLWNPFRIL